MCVKCLVTVCTGCMCFGDSVYGRYAFHYLRVVSSHGRQFYFDRCHISIVCMLDGKYGC